MDGKRLHTLWADCKNGVYVYAFVHQAKYGFELYSLLIFMSGVKCTVQALFNILQKACEKRTEILKHF
jgi:hypothetical protein